MERMYLALCLEELKTVSVCIDDTLLHALCELYHIDSNDLTITPASLISLHYNKINVRPTLLKLT